MPGWGTEESCSDCAEECGYAWFDARGRGEWLHTPPRVTIPDRSQLGNIYRKFPSECSITLFMLLSRLRRLTMEFDAGDDADESVVIFAKGADGADSSCQGDSGSPLVVK